MVKKILSLITVVTVVIGSFNSFASGNKVTTGKQTSPKVNTVSTSQRMSYLEGSGAGNIDNLNNQYTVKVYPNPSNNIVNISFENIPTQNATIAIFDLTGKQVLQQGFNKLNNTVNVSDFNNGVYIYSIYGADGKMLHTGKFNVVK